MRISSFILLCVLLFSCKEDSFKDVLQEVKTFDLHMPVEKFSADSAYAYIENQVGFGPRVPNLISHRFAKNYLVNSLESFGLQPQVQNFNSNNYTGESLQLYNILAQYKPEKTERILLITHWDTRPFADNEKDSVSYYQYPQGANDGGSGTAIFLEIARLLQLEKPDIGIDFLFFDGEESGPPMFDKNFEQKIEYYCLGSQYFSKNNLLEIQPKQAVLVDIVGGMHAEYHFEHLSYDDENSKAKMMDFWALAHVLGYKNKFVPERQYFVGADDHLFVKENLNIPAFAVIEYDKERNSFNKHQHKTSDTLENIDKSSLQAVGSVLWTYIHNF